MSLWVQSTAHTAALAKEMEAVDETHTEAVGSYLEKDVAVDVAKADVAKYTEVVKGAQETVDA